MLRCARVPALHSQVAPIAARIFPPSQESAARTLLPNVGITLNVDKTKVTE